MIPRFPTFLSFLQDIGGEGYELFFRKPLLLAGQQRKKIWEMFQRLPWTPAATIYSGILWVIPLAMAGPYVSLYMVSLGLSKTEVGLYQSLAKLVGPVAFFMGGYLSDVWGRKKSLVLFDILTWGGYCLCLALAVNKWWAIAAILFMAANAASGPAYQCLLIEGTKPKSRSLAYTVSQIANLIPYLLFFPMLGRYWVLQKGLSAANHQMYWFFAFMVVIGVGLRLKFVPHSGAYEKSPQAWFHVVRDGIGQYWETSRKFFRKKTMVVFLVSKCMDEWIFFMWTTYSSLYFVNHMGLKETALSIQAQGIVYVVFVILFFLMPHVTGKWMLRILGLEQLAGLAALAPLLLWNQVGGNVFWICFLSASLAAVSTVFYSSNNAAVWMNIMTEKERAKVVAVSTALISIGLVVTGSAGSLLYGEISPMALIWAMVGMRIINFLILRRVAGLLTPAN
jgi:MFS transporter, DHA1 family, tetracycline resistance protein